MNKNINVDLAKEKGLIVDDNYDLYVGLERIYKYAFEHFLLSFVNLSEYDNRIRNSNLDFGIPHPTKQQLISDLPEYLNLNYIYLLNNFFIEKLDISDINLLKQYFVQSSFVMDNNLTNMIERTYKNVIKRNYFDGKYTDGINKVCYGYVRPDNFCDDDAIVLKIYYSKNTVLFTDEEFLKNIKDKELFLQSLSENIISDVKNKLNINCNILIEKIPN